MTVLVLRFIHILFMAIWLSSSVHMSGDLRRTMAAQNPSLEGITARMKRGALVGLIGGMGTIISGVFLIFALGGFAAVPRAIHHGLTIAIVMVVVSAIGIGGSWGRIRRGHEAGMSWEELGGPVRRLKISIHLLHTMWLVVLMLMVFRNAI